MQKQWVGKNIDLARLSERVETFFKDKGFMTMRDFSTDKYTIVWKSPLVRGSRGVMKVKIIGAPNDFRIEFWGEEAARKSILLGLVTTLFGGGYLIRQGLKQKEALEKIEREFWAYIEGEVEHLVHSAKSQ